ncbi:MAG: DUF456 domain-containing protein [Deltaproteobacteria bacterium]|jgi:uncharacterized protein YqgC (DUF456 family)|nr:DUF456 domain-containing protein [Deltaproteobacteria bacterium]
MSAISVAVAALAVLIMLVGLAGSFLPVLPGLPIIFGAYLGFGLYSHWQYYGQGTMIFAGAVVVISIALDQLAGIVGAKKFGAGRSGMIGAFLGAVIGVIFFSLPGLILGTFLGAAGFELVFAGRDVSSSLKAGTGALLGFLAGSLFKFILGLILTVLFILKILTVL